MMQMDFDFPPATVAMVGQQTNLDRFVLLGGKEVRMTEGMAINVAIATNGSRIFGTPLFHTPNLLGERDTAAAISGNYRRLEVIGQRKDQMYFSFRDRAGKPL